MKTGDLLTFTIHEDEPSLRATFKGRVVGVPTSEAMKGTIKVEVLSFVGEDGKKRRFYRHLVGKHLRISCPASAAEAHP